MKKYLLFILRTIGNSILYGSVFALITGGMVYAATGTNLSGLTAAGVKYVSFFTDALGDGSAGVDAKSVHTTLNGSWFPYPGDNYNYIRGNSYINGTIYDENNTAYYVNPDGTTNVNQLCIKGDCKADWTSVSLVDRYTPTFQNIPNGTHTCTGETGGNGGDGNDYFTKADITDTTIRVYTTNILNNINCDSGIQTVNTTTGLNQAKCAYDASGFPLYKINQTSAYCTDSFGGVQCYITSTITNSSDGSTLGSCTLKLN